MIVKNRFPLSGKHAGDDRGAVPQWDFGCMPSEIELAGLHSRLSTCPNVEQVYVNIATEILEDAVVCTVQSLLECLGLCIDGCKLHV